MTELVQEACELDETARLEKIVVKSRNLRRTPTLDITQELRRAISHGIGGFRSMPGD
ncbi:MAG: hypothetical protein R3C44_20995 [Chloroflexota bacterium]